MSLPARNRAIQPEVVELQKNSNQYEPGPPTQPGEAYPKGKHGGIHLPRARIVHGNNAAELPLFLAALHDREDIALNGGIVVDDRD